MNADLRSFIYFNKKLPSFYTSPEDYMKGSNGWDFNNNPILVNDRNESQYVDFRNQSIMDRISKDLHLSFGILDYIFPIISGFWN